MKVIISDLDGTLLDHYSYSYDAARPALRRLRRTGVPLVICTSKTRAEVEYWRRRLRIHSPFIVENGGAIYVPAGSFPFPLPGAVEREGYAVVESGEHYKDLVETLKLASQESGCRALGFHDMGADEISIRTHLPVRQAELARQREYDEPFEILDSGTHLLLRAIESRGKRWTRGARFYHITGRHDKGAAVRHLADLYRRANGEITTVGLGDRWHDLEFLKVVDVPILIRSGLSDRLRQELPHCIVTTSPGTLGWNEAVLQVLHPHGIESAVTA